MENEANAEISSTSVPEDLASSCKLPMLSGLP